MYDGTNVMTSTTLWHCSDSSVYLCVQQRVGLQEVVEGELPCAQLGGEVLVGGEGPA